MNNKNTAGSIKIFDFKLFHRAIVMKSAWFWHKSKYTDKKNRIKKYSYKFIHLQSSVVFCFCSFLFAKNQKYTLEKHGAGKTGHLHGKECH